METGESAVNANSMVQRIRNILLRPKSEWPVIADEPASIGGLFTSYVMILAAIPAVAQLVGSLVFGYSFLGITYRPSVGAALGTAVVQYGMSLVLVLILGLIIEALAPRFGGERNRLQAMKIAAYSGTAAWLAGAAALVPALSFLAIAGLYSLYLLYLGLPLLMKSAPDKTIVYMIVVVVVAAVLAFVLATLARPLSSSMTGGASSPAAISRMGPSGNLSVPGVGTLNLDRMQEAARQAEQTAKDLNEGKIVATPADALERFLPQKIGRFERVSVESSSMGMGGIASSQVEGRYEAGENHFNLSIMDLPAVGPMAARGAAMGVQRERRTATGYERTHVVDGNFVNEEWDGSRNEGSYSLVVGSRITIKAEGRVSDMNDLRSAISATRPDRLARLLK